ncbi:hypothetical protein E2320_007115, partial [Naja naja]
PIVLCPGSVNGGLFNQEVDLSNLILTMNSLKWALANQFIYSLGDIQENYRGKESGILPCPVDGTDLITFSSVQNSMTHMSFLWLCRASAPINHHSQSSRK